MRKRPILFAALLALLALAAGVRWSSSITKALGIARFDTPPVLIQIQRLKQLVTVRYSIQRVVGLKEAKQPFGEESILLMVQGEVLAGVDLAALKQSDVQASGPHSLIISLPPARLINVSLDEAKTKVWDRQITWWTPWVPFNPDLEHRARLQAIEDVRQAALGLDILPQAQKNAQTAIRDLLNALNIDARFKTRGLD
jgi:hypothetical protein